MSIGALKNHVNSDKAILKKTLNNRKLFSHSLFVSEEARGCGPSTPIAKKSFRSVSNVIS